MKTSRVTGDREAMAPIDITQQFYNQPLLVDESTANALKANAGHRIMRSRDVGADADMYIPGLLGRDAGYKPYAVEDGVAIINVKGYLEHDSYWYGSMWTGYDALRARFDFALEDADVRGIALMISSSGGMVSGNFDLVDHIYSHRGDKPMIAIVNEHAYSAAYSIASAADRVVVARTGGVGSIGVITVHFDYSRYLEEIGIGATIIHAGKHKKDGNSFEALPPEVEARIQARIDDLYTIFVDTVARNRGIESDAVRATEADVFSGVDAIDVGLADAVQAPLEALAAFKNELSGSIIPTGAVAMTTAISKTVAGASPGQASIQNTPEAGYTQEYLDQAVADAEAAGMAKGMAAGAIAEHERIFAILDSEDAEGRKGYAATIAKSKAMTKESASEILAALPAVKATGASADVLDLAMQMTGGGANVGAGEELSAGADNVVTIDTNAIYNNLNKRA